MNDFKKCPFCAEEIKIAAKKCKHCGEWLDKNEPVETKTPQPSGLSSTKKSKKINPKLKLIVGLVFVVLAALALYFYYSKSTTEKYFVLGLKCYSNSDYEEALKWYRKAAEQGHADAQFKLGVCYSNGYNVAKDYKEAAKWFRKAAEQGQADAQDALGVYYLFGYGVAKDYKEAAKWFRKAAEQGNANAQYNLGDCYSNGYGIAKDYKEAVKWLRKAAEQGNERAIGILKNNPYADPYVISCLSNLKQILLSMKQYAMDYGDKFPSGNGMSGFNELIKKDYLTDLGVYLCHSFNPKTSGTSYIYLGGFMEGDSDRYGHANTPLVFDMPKNHNKIMNISSPKNPYKIINVGFLNGHVKSIKYSGEITTVRDVIDLLNKRESYPVMHLKILYEKADQVDRELSKVK